MMAARHRPLRVVLDTNVLVSALVFPGGAPAELRHAWQAGRIVPLVGRATVAELLRVLAYPKFRLDHDEQDRLAADVLPYAEAVDDTRPAAPTPNCRDPADRPFLELAVAGRADALVTGDRDLLALAMQFPIPLLTPAELLARLRR